MNEIVPIAGGLLLGVCLWAVPARWRWLTGVLGAVLIGVLATVVSGEYRISWEFLLFDIPLAAASTLAAYVGARQLAARVAARRETGDGWER